jgi:AraC-like DNA-binding protein
MVEGMGVSDGPLSAGRWRRSSFRSVEQLAATVTRARPGVAWTAAQLSAGPLVGVVASCVGRRARLTCTRVAGSYELRGPLSTRSPVLALGLRLEGASSMWLKPIETGSFGLVQPGLPIDCVMRGSSFYLTMDVSPEALEEEAERQGLVIADSGMRMSGMAPSVLPGAELASIVALVERAMRAEEAAAGSELRLDEILLEALVGRIGREPQTLHTMPQGGYGRIVARARAFIEANLEAAITIDQIAAAGFASRRTLHRAFHEILGETPHGYVLKLRLNRIRQELAGQEEARRTITMVAHKWGLPELGRMAAQYREQFGELPSETLARRSA